MAVYKQYSTVNEGLILGGIVIPIILALLTSIGGALKDKKEKEKFKNMTKDDQLRAIGIKNPSNKEEIKNKKKEVIQSVKNDIKKIVKEANSNDMLRYSIEEAVEDRYGDKPPKYKIIYKDTGEYIKILDCDDKDFCHALFDYIQGHVIFAINEEYFKEVCAGIFKIKANRNNGYIYIK